MDFDEEEREQYQNAYMDTVKELSKNTNSEDREEVFDLMAEKYNQRHSESGKVDAELNWLKSENEFKRKSRFDTHVESLLRYQAEESGKPLAEVKRAARKIMKEGK